MQVSRERVVSDLPGAPCQLCGAGTRVARSQAVRRGLARLNPRWDPELNVYELCQGCGAKHRVGGHLA